MSNNTNNNTSNNTSKVSDYYIDNGNGYAEENRLNKTDLHTINVEVRQLWSIINSPTISSFMYVLLENVKCLIRITYIETYISKYFPGSDINDSENISENISENSLIIEMFLNEKRYRRCVNIGILYNNTILEVPTVILKMTYKKKHINKIRKIYKCFNIDTTPRDSILSMLYDIDNNTIRYLGELKIR